MKLQKQDGPECILATIAMLSDKPIELIRRRACGKLGIPSWTNFRRGVPNPKHYWKAVNYLVRFYGLQDMVHSGDDGSPMAGVDSKTRTYDVKPDKPMDFQGKGQIIFHVYSFLGAQRGSHSVAVENGMVYDSNMDKPIALKEYWGLMWSHYSPGYDGLVNIWSPLKVKG